MSPLATYLGETFATLVVVCGLAFVVLVGARRLGVGRPRGPLTLVGQLPLDARRSIYLVRIGEQVLVVGASETGLTRLGEVRSDAIAPDAADAAAAPSRSRSFAAALAHAISPRARRADPPTANADGPARG